MAGNQRKLQHHETAMNFPNALALLIPLLQHWSFWMACVRKIGWRETMGNYAGNPMSNCKNDNFLCPSIAPEKKEPGNLAPWMMLVYRYISSKIPCLDMFRLEKTLPQWPICTKKSLPRSSPFFPAPSCSSPRLVSRPHGWGTTTFASGDVDFSSDKLRFKQQRCCFKLSKIEV